jgi:anti-anti-sigma factor
LLVEAVHGPAPGDLVVRVCGEVDLLTHRRLRSALDDIALDDVTSIRLELGDLRFCDAHGARMLNSFVHSGRVRGRRVAVEGPSPMLRKLLDLFDVRLLAPFPVPRMAS